MKKALRTVEILVSILLIVMGIVGGHIVAHMNLGFLNPLDVMNNMIEDMGPGGLFVLVLVPFIFLFVGLYDLTEVFVVGYFTLGIVVRSIIRIIFILRGKEDKDAKYNKSSILLIVFSLVVCVIAYNNRGVLNVIEITYFITSVFFIFLSVARFVLFFASPKEEIEEIIA